MSMELEMATCPLHEGQLPEKEDNVRKAAELRDSPDGTTWGPRPGLRPVYPGLIGFMRKFVPFHLSLFKLNFCPLQSQEPYNDSEPHSSPRITPPLW